MLGIGFVVVLGVLAVVLGGALDGGDGEPVDLTAPRDGGENQVVEVPDLTATPTVIATAAPTPPGQIGPREQTFGLDPRLSPRGGREGFSLGAGRPGRTVEGGFVVGGCCVIWFVMRVVQANGWLCKSVLCCVLLLLCPSLY